MRTDFRLIAPIRKKSGVVACACNPRFRRMRWEDLWGLMDSQSSQVVSSKFSERPCLTKVSQRTVMEDNWLLPTVAWRLMMAPETQPLQLPLNFGLPALWGIKQKQTIPVTGSLRSRYKSPNQWHHQVQIHRTASFDLWVNVSKRCPGKNMVFLGKATPLSRNH